MEADSRLKKSRSPVSTCCGASVLPGFISPFVSGAKIQVDGSVGEYSGWMAPGMSESFEFTKFCEIPVPWEVAITCDGADNCSVFYPIRG